MLGASMLADTAPAAAECSEGPHVRVDHTALGPWQYNCYFHCQVLSGAVLRNFALLGRDEMLFCRARCSQNHRCRAVAWHDEWTVVGGRRTAVRYCALYGAGELSIADYVAPPHEVNTHVTCVLDRKTPDPSDLDLDKLKQDQVRPGVPGPVVPKVP